MRKHFLILMLLTLLPFTAWAEDLSNASVAVGNIVKGTAAPSNPFVVWEGEELTKDTHYTVDANYYTRSGEAPNYTYTSVGSNLSAKSFGTYYLKIVGKPENGFNGVAYGAFEITKRPLTIDFDGVDATYGANPTAVTYTIRDGETALNPAVEADAAIIASLGIQTVTKSGANEIEITNTTGVGSYDFDFSYNEGDDCDYTLTRKTGDNDKYVIGAKEITIGMVTMGAAGTYNYTGNAITGLPTFTVTDGETEVTTFNVKWFAAELVADDPETQEVDESTSDDAKVTPKNAGTYYARVTGEGNYAGKVFDNANWKITVNKVPLTVLVNPKSKTYDGVAYTTAAVEYTFGGLVDADQGKVNTLTPKVDGNAWVDFKNYKENGYTISVDVTNAKIGTGEGAIDLDDNYIVTPVSSIWTINKITGLTISAADKSINFNDNIFATSEITATGALEAEKAAIEALYVAPKANGAKNNVYGTQPDIYTPVLKDAATYYENSEDAKAAAEAVLANYATPYTINAGSLSVGGQNATIMPIVASVIYDGEEHPATGYSANSGAYILKAWDGETGDIDVSSISYKYKKQNADLTWPDENGWTTTVPSAVGVYRAQVAATSVSLKGSFAGAELARPEVQFEIQARPITITVTGATLHKGDKEANLEGHTLFTKEGSYVEGETIVLKPVFVEGVEGLTLNATTKKVENGAGTVIEGAVKLTDDVEGENDNANYKFTFNAGPLTIAASALVLDPTDETLAAKITDAEATGEKYEITFNHLKMNVNEWYAMVLPFDIDPKEMVYAADRYVVFNELNVTGTTDQNFKFTLKFDPILAGTPFLVKFAANADDEEGQKVDWADFAFVDNSNEIPAAMTFDITADPNNVETDFVTFKGTYAPFSMQNTKNGANDADLQDRVWWLCDTNYDRGSKPRVNTWLKPTSNAHTVAPMEAYLIAAEGWTNYAPTITVEDFDGTVTAIKSISANEIHNLNAEGMYNLNGMKMNSVPTQKGVYIVNGKKVVIK